LARQRVVCFLVVVVGKFVLKCSVVDRLNRSVNRWKL
jgi:hypothetical protein